MRPRHKSSLTAFSRINVLCLQVILSSDRGVTWSRVTTAAPWSPRSDVVSTVQPGTNNVLTLGGANNNNGVDFSDGRYTNTNKTLPINLTTQSSLLT